MKTQLSVIRMLHLQHRTPKWKDRYSNLKHIFSKVFYEIHHFTDTGPPTVRLYDTLPVSFKHWFNIFNTIWMSCGMLSSVITLCAKVPKHIFTFRTTLAASFNIYNQFLDWKNPILPWHTVLFNECKIRKYWNEMSFPHFEKQTGAMHKATNYN